MDFQLSPDTDALRELLTRILTECSSPDRLTEFDRSGEWFDRRTYRALAAAGVIGATLGDDVGGAGLGLLDLHFVLEQLGAHVAQVPLWETVVLGAHTIERHGSAVQRKRWLPGVVGGTVLLTAALLGPGAADPRLPSVRARPTDDGWQLNGVLSQVPLAAYADRILVPAGTDDRSVMVFLIDPQTSGAQLEAQDTASRRPCSRLKLIDVEVEVDDLVGADGSAVLDDLLLRAESGLASIQSGVCAAALQLAASHAATRQQFGRVIASFQAVGQRLADAYVDAEAIRLTSLQAAWRLDEGLDSAEAVAIAKWWAAEAGHRVLHSAQHVHGGIGIDLSYPLHRYFMLGKEIEFSLGHATLQLSRIGRTLAQRDE